MKTLNIPLEDKEYDALTKVKGNRTWRRFIEDIIERGKNIGGNDKKHD